MRFPFRWVLFASLLTGSFAQVPGPAAASVDRPVTLRAAHRGGPYLNLRDGHALRSNYVGGDVRVQALRNNQARPLSLASADFDEDGMPDLLCGYATSDGLGIVAIHRGNVDALWPYGAALRNGDPPAFLPDVRVFGLPEAPDFVAAGDFNADGHWDIVAAKRGSRSLWFLAGDGHGGFGNPQQRELAGRVTAFAAGEVNRADGLTDFVVGVDSDQGPRALVFESPMGAWRADPEEFRLPAPATGFAMAALDGTMHDVVIAAGRDLLVVEGRDRKLTLGKSERSNVAPAKVTRQRFPFKLRSIVLGNFSTPQLELAALGDDSRVHLFSRARPGWTARGDVAVPGGDALSAGHISAAGPGDLMVLDRDSKQVHVLSAAPARSGRKGLERAASLDAAGSAPVAVLPMRLNQHPLSGLVMLHSGESLPSIAPSLPLNIFTVTNTSDSGAGSLRQAITDANAAQGAASIVFNIPNTDPNRDPTTGAFKISPVVQNTNQIGPYIEALPAIANIMTIDGYTQPGAAPNTQGNGDNAIIRIEISGALNNNQAVPGGSGFSVSIGVVNAITIRGFAINDWDSLNTALGNFDAASEPCLGPTGEFSGDVCVTSSGANGGIGIVDEACSSYIEGNFIGTDVTGTTAKPNVVGIVELNSCAIPIPGPSVGGTQPQARNLISGNRYSGIATVNFAPIQGNFVGTDHTGTAGIQNPLGSSPPNGFKGNGEDGVTCYCNATIGGTAAGAGNVISGNGFYNLRIAANGSAASDSGPGIGGALIQGNIIGADVTGTQSVLPHNGAGIALLSNASGNTIGGSTPAARNIVSGNQTDGILLADASFNNIVEGNYIGVDATGTRTLPQGDGIHISPVNGTLPAIQTVITGNIIGGGLNGIEVIGDAGAIMCCSLAQNIIQGNFIGTDVTGTINLGNVGDGIHLEQNPGGIGASNNLIGGTDQGLGNVIAFNGGNGVDIDPGGPMNGSTPGNNQVIGNSIFSNGGTGVIISSSSDNVVSRNSISQNANLGLVLNFASNSTPGGNCQSASHPSSPNQFQNAPVLTAGSGNTFVSATATDPNGNTSAFSNCVAVSSGSTFNIAGMLNSLANTAFTLEFFKNDACDASGFGQGKTYLGSLTVTTNGSCTASFNQSINIAQADMSVSLRSNNGAFLGNPSPALLTAVVTNNGGGTAHNVTVTDNVPATLSVTSVTTTQGTCNTGNSVSCNLGTMIAGATATIVIQFSALTADSVNDTVNVAATEPDPNSANNSSTVAVNPSYLLPVIDHFDPPSVVAGSSDLMLNIYGANWVAGATTVTFAGTPLQINAITTVASDGTNFSNTGCAHGVKSCQQVTVLVPASLLTTPGTPTIVSTNPAPGGGTFSSLSMGSNKRFTIVASCSYTVSPNTTQTIGNGACPGTGNPPLGCTAGGTLTFSVMPTPTSCTWRDSSSVPWLVPEFPGDFQGNNADIVFEFPPNPGAARTGTITIAGQTITVNQAGGAACFLTLTDTSENYSAGGGTGSFGILETPGRCLPWTATSDSPWLTITSGGASDSLNDSGTLAYSVAPNPGPGRVGNITVPGAGTFTVTQGAIGGATCTFTLMPTSSNVSAAAGSGSFNVNASDQSCSWTASSNSGFVSITSGASGTGNGTVSYSVTANSGAARPGTITAAGQTFTINQAAASGVCSFSLSTPSANATVAGGGGSFGLTASDPSCAWTAMSNAAWITITSPASGMGSTTVSYTVAANAGAARSGTITAGGQTFTVNQAGVSITCTFNLNTSSANVANTGGMGMFNLTASDQSCAWTAVSNVLWISVTSTPSGTGNAVISYSVAANPGATRMGTITAGGLTFTITQGFTCAFTFNPPTLSLPASGGPGSFTLTGTDSSCTWMAATNVPWVTLTGTTSGTGSGTITFTVAANVGGSRVGNITAGGQTFAVLQDASCATSRNGCTNARLNPTFLTFVYVKGDPPPQAQEISVYLDESATFQPVNIFNTPWMHLSSSASEITVRVDPTGLAPGVYGAQVGIVGEDLTLVRNANIQLWVYPSPYLYSVPASVTFNYQPGGPSPPSQVVFIGASSKVLPFTVTANVPWIHWSQLSSNASTYLTVWIDTSALSGNQSGSITLTSPNAAAVVIPVAAMVASP